MKPTLFTDRLILRPFKMEDAEAVTLLLRDRRVVEMMRLIPHPYTLTDAGTWLERIINYGPADPHWIFAITLRETGELIGCLGLHGEERDPVAEFGYWFGHQYWGNGYATEALLAVLEYGFEKVGLVRIEATHLPHNPASGRVMQKAGLRREGLRRQCIRRGDDMFDLVTYGMTIGDWRESAAPAETK